MGSKTIAIILSAFMFFGILTTYLGIRTINKDNELSKNYVSVKAKFVGESAYSGDTYSLTYSYFVNGKEYKISTDYGTSSIPEIGTTKTIKYNPNDPSKAIITGSGSNTLILFVGLTFILVPLIGFTTFAVNKGRTIKSLSGAFTGLVLIFLGCGVYILMCTEGDSLSLISASKTNGLWVLVPILFVIGGICTVYASIFRPELLKSKDLVSMIIGIFSPKG